ncbi:MULTISPECIES: glycosyltransferase family 2 protein [unclassified Carboxydocella]|uniref:tetratricopeptide repeat-containing glycosyltransferase family 2 protein n=1 Tax=unclassified Carboxydocella TaxID=2685367 RepID=UPI0009AD561C|nr:MULTISPECIES: glycosyltransferase family 2 protein [unclassified Carboxydocella]GAW29559.1 glycosyl transferase family 2 [Carboxydocella sp. ULO1]GAW31791.1 glycosyl transferase family 2 [Carboxydocella sp. JDF658]
MLLSLCMIVKNEENCLARCLTSVQELVDEIIIVDTGSTDRTLEIAASFSARLFSCPWTHDFSQARNFALEQARGDWILVLDADEVLIHQGREQLQRFLTAPGSLYEGFYLPVINLHEPDNWLYRSQDLVVRLFRNRPHYRFSGVIHEQVLPSIAAHAGKEAIGQAPLTIYHYGYLPAVIQQKQKCQRNQQVIQLALTQNKQDPFLLYSLGCEYLTAANPRTALHYFEQALAVIPTGAGYLPDLALRAGYCHFLLGNWADAEKYAPLAPQLYLLLALQELEQNNYAAAETLLTLAARGCPEARTQIQQARGDMALARQQPAMAARYYLAALQSQPTYLYPLTRLLELAQTHPRLWQDEWFCLYTPDSCLRLLQFLNWQHDTRLVLYYIMSLAYQKAFLPLKQLEQQALPCYQAVIYLALGAVFSPDPCWSLLSGLFWKEEGWL